VITRLCLDKRMGYHMYREWVSYGSFMFMYPHVSCLSKRQRSPWEGESDGYRTVSKHRGRIGEWKMLSFDKPDTHTRLMLLHDSRNEDGIKNFFQEVHELYIKVTEYLPMHGYHKKLALSCFMLNRLSHVYSSSILEQMQSFNLLL
jgi:hypothetical protein